MGKEINLKRELPFFIIIIIMSEEMIMIATLLDLMLPNMRNYTEKEITEMMSIMTNAIETYEQEEKAKNERQAKRPAQYGDLADFLKSEGVL